MRVCLPAEPSTLCEPRVAAWFGVFLLKARIKGGRLGWGVKVGRNTHLRT